MKKTFTILLLSMMLIPLFWNAMGFMHYLVEHTHTFCASEQDHEHTSTEDCHTICHITPEQEEGHMPHAIEFYELKQFISDYYSFNAQILSSNHISTKPNYDLLYGRIIPEDIFRPPIS